MQCKNQMLSNEFCNLSLELEYKYKFMTYFYLSLKNDIFLRSCIEKSEKHNNLFSPEHPLVHRLWSPTTIFTESNEDSSEKWLIWFFVWTSKWDYSNMTLGFLQFPKARKLSRHLQLSNEHKCQRCVIWALKWIFTVII